MTRMFQLMAQLEGYGEPGKIPTVRNNPLDLKHSPHSSHEGIGPDDIGIIDTPEHGEEDGERQLQLWAERGLTIREAIQEQTGWTSKTGDVEGNNTQEYLDFVCNGIGLSPDTLLGVALEISAV